MSAYEKVFQKNNLYSVTSKEMKTLCRHLDPSVRGDTRKIFLPVFKLIEQERKRIDSYDGKINVKIAESEDFDDIMNLINRVEHDGDRTGIQHWSKKDLEVRLKNGIILVAETASGYIVGLFSMMVKEEFQRKFGYDSVIMVSKLFRGKGIADQLFDKLIIWAKENNLTEIKIETLSDAGRKHIESVKKRRTELKITVANEFSTYISL